MLTPYDWQEGIGNRAQYIESKLSQGLPVVAVSLEEGILVLTYRRQSQKVFEVYDRLVFAAIGRQTDIEAIRMAALEFTHREGYNRSEDDVTIQRVVTAVSTPIKRAFGDFGSAPIVARSIFGEVGDHPESDLFYVVDYDGDFALRKRGALVAGHSDRDGELEAKLGEISPTLTVSDAAQALEEIWRQAMDAEALQEIEARTPLTREVVLLERSNARVNRFRTLEPEEALTLR
jgi:proteasome alpha subunit